MKKKAGRPRTKQRFEPSRFYEGIWQFLACVEHYEDLVKKREQIPGGLARLLEGFERNLDRNFSGPLSKQALIRNSMDYYLGPLALLISKYRAEKWSDEELKRAATRVLNDSFIRSHVLGDEPSNEEIHRQSDKDRMTVELIIVELKKERSKLQRNTIGPRTLAKKVLLKAHEMGSERAVHDLVKETVYPSSAIQFYLSTDSIKKLLLATPVWDRQDVDRAIEELNS